MNTKKHPAKAGLIAGVYFGGFQALMPTLGYICGGTIRQYIEAVSKYVALFLLCIIGINMIRENLKGECKGTSRDTMVALNKNEAEKIMVEVRQ